MEEEVFNKYKVEGSKRGAIGMERSTQKKGDINLVSGEKIAGCEDFLFV